MGARGQCEWSLAPVTLVGDGLLLADDPHLPDPPAVRAVGGDVVVTVLDALVGNQREGDDAADQNQRHGDDQHDLRGVTQSAFSRRIRALEEWLGTDLLSRDSYPVTLTPEGVLFRETAEETVRMIHARRAEFRDHARARGGDRLESAPGRPFQSRHG